MKKVLLLCMSMMVLPVISAQVLLWEDFSGNQYTIVATAEKVAPIRGIAPVLHIVLAESGVPNSPGTTGFIERLMVPDEYGTDENGNLLPN
jgi:hypothetical protein